MQSSETLNLEADIRQKSKSLKESLLKYETVLTAQLYLRIFSITGPISKYLQTEGIDYLKCHQMITNSILLLKNIFRDFDTVREQYKTSKEKTDV